MKETHKQRLRRLLDRVKLDEKVRRQAAEEIEKLSDEDAADLVAAIDQMEQDSPGLIDQVIEKINRQASAPDA